MDLMEERYIAWWQGEEVAFCTSVLEEDVLQGITFSCPSPFSSLAAAYLASGSGWEEEEKKRRIVNL